MTTHQWIDQIAQGVILSGGYAYLLAMLVNYLETGSPYWGASTPEHVRRVIEGEKLSLIHISEPTRQRRSS